MANAQSSKVNMPRAAGGDLEANQIEKFDVDEHDKWSDNLVRVRGFVSVDDTRPCSITLRINMDKQMVYFCYFYAALLALILIFLVWFYL